MRERSQRTAGFWQLNGTIGAPASFSVSRVRSSAGLKGYAGDGFPVGAENRRSAHALVNTVAVLIHCVPEAQTRTEAAAALAAHVGAAGLGLATEQGLAALNATKEKMVPSAPSNIS